MQAFENVMPSEKTRLSLTVKDSSIKATTLHHPGALVLHMGILKFTINLIGDSPDLAFALSVPAAGILAIDNVADISTIDGRASKDGISRWKVRFPSRVLESLLMYNIATRVCIAGRAI